MAAPRSPDCRAGGLFEGLKMLDMREVKCPMCDRCGKDMIDLRRPYKMGGIYYLVFCTACLQRYRPDGIRVYICFDAPTEEDLVHAAIHQAGERPDNRLPEVAPPAPGART